MTKTMNTKQQRTLSNVKNYVLRNGRYEVKELSIEDNEFDNDMRIVLEVGRPNDEGTLAESICRSCYSFYIGTRGGMYIFNKNYHREYIETYELCTKADIYRR